MDIERAMEFIVANLASTTAKLEAMAERQAEADKRQDAAEKRHEKDFAKLNDILRRAIKASVEEHRRERVRRQQMAAEFDERITKLASAQLQAEEETRQLKASLKTFLDSLRRGGNGHQ